MYVFGIYLAYADGMPLEWRDFALNLGFHGCMFFPGPLSTPASPSARIHFATLPVDA